MKELLEKYRFSEEQIKEKKEMLEMLSNEAQTIITRTKIMALIVEINLGVDYESFNSERHAS